MVNGHGIAYMVRKPTETNVYGLQENKSKI